MKIIFYIGIQNIDTVKPEEGGYEWYCSLGGGFVYIKVTTKLTTDLPKTISLFSKLNMNYQKFHDANKYPAVSRGLMRFHVEMTGYGLSKFALISCFTTRGTLSVLGQPPVQFTLG